LKTMIMTIVNMTIMIIVNMTIMTIVNMTIMTIVNMTIINTAMKNTVMIIVFKRSPTTKEKRKKLS